MWQDAVWIGIPKSELEKWKILEGDLTGRFAYYRYEIELKETAELTIDITANSRYRLWINGKPVLSGPCKGDLYRHFYETVNVSAYLKTGKNVFAVQVLYNNACTAIHQTDERAGIFGVFTPGGGHRLAVEGIVRNKSGDSVGMITTGAAEWKVWLDGSYYLKSYEVNANLGAVCEELDYHQIPANWKKEDFDSSVWSRACVMEPVKSDAYWEAVGIVPRFVIKERPIPLLYEKEHVFEKEITTGHSKPTKLLEEGVVCIEAGEKKTILLDAGKIVNGYPGFTFDGGEMAVVRITYFERFTGETEEIRRDDAEKGTYSGITDCLILDGKERTFEPFWYRTFRFVAIEVETKDVVQMSAPVFRKTGYPLDVISKVESEAPWVNEVWEMCVRTLENCMMETYMDCPYYEQMQFPMDTRLQAVFTYMVSGDTRLAKKALEDYHCSMIPEGLIHGKYPSCYTQIISTFSMHYIYMLKEYYQQTEDMKTVRTYFPDMDRILAYYDSKIGTDGMVGRLGYWEFVDWQPVWLENRGVPTAVLHGPSTIINLMYAYSLECAAWLNELAGRIGISEEYRMRRAGILDRVQERCWDEKRKMYREGPAYEQYTCHAQAWAVLNNLPDRETAKSMLTHAAKDADVLKCSFSTAYEWFRACEQAGVYELTMQDMKKWIELPGMGCTCCPETPENSRSECHAWSALPMYEMICSMAGIRVNEAGWKSVRIAPHMAGMEKYGVTELKGQAATPYGVVKFSYQWREEAGTWKYLFSLPNGLQGEFIDEDGTVRQIPMI